MKRFSSILLYAHLTRTRLKLCALGIPRTALRASMCTAVAPRVGSGWEANIARLIDQANETLRSSAYLRHDHANGARTPSSHMGHRNTLRQSSPLRSAVPATFRGDRGASYRRGSEGWDAPLFARGRGGDGGLGDRFPPSHPPSPYSSVVAARVEGAKIDGMEDRIKLEVQTNVSTFRYLYRRGHIV